MKNIPLHQLKERSSVGWEIRHFRMNDGPREAKDLLGAHRDDHYLFFFIESGTASIMIDFKKINFKNKPSFFYILPGQVHYRIRGHSASGWFIAIDSAMVQPEFRAVFENQFVLQQPIALSSDHQSDCKHLFNLMEAKLERTKKDDFHTHTVRSLLDTFIGIVAGHYRNSVKIDLGPSRPALISQSFKKLLNQQVSKIKRPAEYAAQLHISETYLNEVVKKTTGLSVSYWILEEVILEAKRMLFYSQLNVKEIAGELGYDDHTYFSRIFKKGTGMTPLGFRSKYRE
jgi:AraC family transcriptional regulator, transcriptional activator of pobA